MENYGLDLHGEMLLAEYHSQQHLYLQLQDVVTQKLGMQLKKSDIVINSMEFRIKQIMAKQNIDYPAARKFILQREATRASFYNYYTGKTWGSAESYDLCIDASILGLQATEKLIADYIRKRFGL
jgi:cytidylate kinase